MVIIGLAYFEPRRAEALFVIYRGHIMDGSQTNEEIQAIELRGTCPYCLSALDVHLDKKQRPYWTCLSCGTRTFATKVALDSFKDSGWIWTKTRPLDVVRKWLKQMTKAVAMKGRRDSDD